MDVRITRTDMTRATVLVVIIAGCSGAETGPIVTTSGGNSSTGGLVGSGGTPTTGGLPPTTGGAPAATGGFTTSGGATTLGGANAGGTVTSGGSGSGGMSSMGGSGVGSGGVAKGGSASNTGGSKSGSGGTTSSSGGKASGGATSGGMAGGTSTVTGGNTGVAGGSGAAVPGAGCGKSRTLQNGLITVDSGGTSRSYYLRMPANYDSAHPYRLIFGYHGLSGSGRDLDGSSSNGNYYGMMPQAGTTSIFVAPNGLESGGDTGWPNTGGQDVAFADAIVAQVQADLCIDTSRIFSFGFSYGGAMSFALACARPNVFRGIAAFCGGALSGCSGGTMPIAFFAAHGNDTLRSGAETNRDRFVKANGCMAQAPATVTAGSGTHICTKYEGCSVGHPVEWCDFDAGHTFAPRDQGASSSWLPKEAWDFINQF